MDDLPHSMEAEQALLGAVLLSPRAILELTERLTPDEFYHPAHSVIWQAMLDCERGGVKPDLPAIAARLKGDEAFAQSGGSKYLAGLAAGAVTAANAKDYAATLRDLHQRRVMIYAGRDLVQRAGCMDTPAAQIAAAHATELDPVLTGGAARDVRHVEACMDEAIADWQEAAKAGKPLGLMTGLHRLDHLLRGLRPGRMGVIAGRPAMGKTAMALTLIRAAAAQGAVVGMWSLEMDGADLAQRILCAEAGINPEDADMGRLRADDFAALMGVRQRYAQMGVYIDDSPALTPSALRARAMQLKRRKGLGLIVVDYIGLMDPDFRRGTRAEDVGEITRALKTLSKEADAPVIALSQLNRGVEQRDDKRPMLSDLRDSGSVEQDADFVAFLYREEYYLTREEPGPQSHKWPEWREKLNQAQGKAEIIVAKQRRGPTGTALVRFDGAATSFENLPE